MSALKQHSTELTHVIGELEGGLAALSLGDSVPILPNTSIEGCTRNGGPNARRSRFGRSGALSYTSIRECDGWEATFARLGLRGGRNGYRNVLQQFSRRLVNCVNDGNIGDVS